MPSSRTSLLEPSFFDCVNFALDFGVLIERNQIASASQLQRVSVVMEPMEGSNCNSIETWMPNGTRRMQAELTKLSCSPFPLPASIGYQFSNNSRNRVLRHSIDHGKIVFFQDDTNLR